MLRLEVKIRNLCVPNVSKAVERLFGLILHLIDLRLRPAYPLYSSRAQFLLPVTDEFRWGRRVCREGHLRHLDDLQLFPGVSRFTARYRLYRTYRLPCVRDRLRYRRARCRTGRNTEKGRSYNVSLNHGSPESHISQQCLPGTLALSLFSWIIVPQLTMTCRMSASD